CRPIANSIAGAQIPAMSFAVAILGRPNVGKSTLFNRLVGRRLALVDDTPGVTRDRREGEGRIADLTFRVTDTAGLEEAAPGSLAGRLQEQTERALADADVARLVIDAREGVTAGVRQTTAARNRRAAECRKIHPGQQNGWRGTNVDRSRGRDHSRLDLRRLELARTSDAARRYRRIAPQAARRGQARAALGRGRAA